MRSYTHLLPQLRDFDGTLMEWTASAFETLAARLDAHVSTCELQKLVPDFNNTAMPWMFDRSAKDNTTTVRSTIATKGCHDIKDSRERWFKEHPQIKQLLKNEARAPEPAPGTPQRRQHQPAPAAAGKSKVAKALGPTISVSSAIQEKPVPVQEPQRPASPVESSEAEPASGRGSPTQTSDVSSEKALTSGSESSSSSSNSSDDRHQEALRQKAEAKSKAKPGGKPSKPRAKKPGAKGGKRKAEEAPRPRPKRKVADGKGAPREDTPPAVSPRQSADGKIIWQPSDFDKRMASLRRQHQHKDRESGATTFAVDLRELHPTTKEKLARFVDDDDYLDWLATNLVFQTNITVAPLIINIEVDPTRPVDIGRSATLSTASIVSGNNTVAAIQTHVIPKYSGLPESFFIRQVDNV